MKSFLNDILQEYYNIYKRFSSLKIFIFLDKIAKGCIYWKNDYILHLEIQIVFIVIYYDYSIRVADFM
jgi:hypothetical protein